MGRGHSVRGTAQLIVESLTCAPCVGIFDVLDGGVGASFSGATTTTHNMRMYTPGCKQGWYANGASCVKCPAGTYGPAPFIAGVGSCVPCPAGTFNTQAGQAVCRAWVPCACSSSHAVPCSRCAPRARQDIGAQLSE